MRGHGLKIHDTIFSWAFFAEPSLLLPLLLYSLLLKPAMWEMWVLISAISLTILVIEAWQLRV
jgi:hypothetical protein